MDQSRTIAGSDRTQRDTTRRGDRRSVLVGVVTALVVAGLGVLLLGFPARAWTASSSLIVLPNPTASPTDAAGLYDQLSNQVVATFASVVQSADATAAAPLSGPTRVVVTPVAETTLISVTATSPDPQLSVRLADQVATTGVRTLTALRTPFTTAVLSPAAPTLTPAPTTDPTLVVGVIAVVALVAGLAVQQGVWLATRSAARWRDLRDEEGTAHPVPRRVVEETVDAPAEAVGKDGGVPRPPRSGPRYVRVPDPEDGEGDPTTTEFSVAHALVGLAPRSSSDTGGPLGRSADGRPETAGATTDETDDEDREIREPHETEAGTGSATEAEPSGPSGPSPEAEPRPSEADARQEEVEPDETEVGLGEQEPEPEAETETEEPEEVRLSGGGDDAPGPSPTPRPREHNVPAG